MGFFALQIWSNMEAEHVCSDGSIKIVTASIILNKFILKTHTHDVMIRVMSAGDIDYKISRLIYCEIESQD